MRYVSSNTDLDEPVSGAWRNTSIGLIWASFLFLAFVYVVAGMVAATHGKVSRQSLFTIAAAPACVAGVLFWLERGRTIGERRQRLLRGLAVLLAGVTIVACAAGAQQ